MQHAMHTNVQYICQKRDVFLRAFGGPLGSVLDSHAAGPGSIPDYASVMKVARVLKCGVVQR